MWLGVWVCIHLSMYLFLIIYALFIYFYYLLCIYLYVYLFLFIYLNMHAVFVHALIFYNISSPKIALVSYVLLLFETDSNESLLYCIIKEFGNCKYRPKSNSYRLKIAINQSNNQSINQFFITLSSCIPTRT